jgi:hypothetical protein
MKLYTEKQVQHAIQIARASQNFFSTPFIYDEHEIIEQLKPIELPSDEEITDKALEVGYTNNLFTLGAKWMRDKIQGGDK